MKNAPKLRGYLHKIETNSDRLQICNLCSRLHETGMKYFVDYMRPVKTQKQELYDFHKST